MMRLFSLRLSRPLVTAFTAALCAVPARSQSCPAAVASDFKKVTLVGSGVLKEPIELSVAKDGKVFVVQRNGDITLYNPATGQSSLAIHLDVYINSGAYDVGGALGVAVAPDFPADNWVYLYYVPKASFTGHPNNQAGRMTYRLSRFRFVGSALDMNSEQTLLEVKSIWETHNGGSLKFGKDGDLYLSTGDNHAPGCSDQYSPMDERAGRSWCDDQGTTANTNDLRGKILRIHPEATQQASGKYYSIPKNNLKEKYASLWPTAESAAKVLPEIYTMGHRNPYRIFPDPVTGKLFIAENGPASQDDAERGPAGADQWKVTDEAANFGYPYFLKNNQPYCHWNYEYLKCVPIQGQAGMKYDPLKPVNHSPNNTGVNILPPAKPAALWEHDGPNADPIGGLKACGPGTGPVYHFNPTLDSKVKFPMEFDNKWLFHPIMSSGWNSRNSRRRRPISPPSPRRAILPGEISISPRACMIWNTAPGTAPCTRWTTVPSCTAPTAMPAYSRSPTTVASLPSPSVPQTGRLEETPACSSREPENAWPPPREPAGRNSTTPRERKSGRRPSRAKRTFPSRPTWAKAFSAYSGSNGAQDPLLPSRARYLPPFPAALRHPQPHPTRLTAFGGGIPPPDNLPRHIMRSVPFHQDGPSGKPRIPLSKRNRP
jgi:glucose/arabinose dehydrogenase